ncbi:hypothetical protein ZWY2020_037913 [Hordeum vulgare]|nr:hypothetical protein ZWY2020_037913 [Hordeum vulgare]
MARASNVPGISGTSVGEPPPPPPQPTMDPFFAADDGNAADDLQRIASHPSTTLKTTPPTPWRPTAAREGGGDDDGPILPSLAEMGREEGALLREWRRSKNVVYGLQVAASFAAEGAVMKELKQWNELYGEGGPRKKQQLTYFL